MRTKSTKYQKYDQLVARIVVSKHKNIEMEREKTAQQRVSNV